MGSKSKSQKSLFSTTLTTQEQRDEMVATAVIGQRNGIRGISDKRGYSEGSVGPRGQSNRDPAEYAEVVLQGNFNVYVPVISDTG